MRKLFVVLAATGAAALLSGFAAQGQEMPRFSWSTAVGAGIGLNRPSSAPVVWRVTGYYNVSRRFSAGAGTGLSFYEKALVPVFADLRLLVARPRRFTPYAECAAGYAFAPHGDANGGFMFGPSAGVQYALRGGMHLFFSAGYEWQELERLKKCANPYFAAEFGEKLRHGTLLLKAGVLF